ncbi:YhdP family protein [Crenobacter cavernae]|uniref:YhdP family protein n=1 Tax=Crenobacter cavernae TaxID=2290923 RepID=UPI001419FC69|nr:YhdP family protein [Crenobacter cavernae]
MEKRLSSLARPLLRFRVLRLGRIVLVVLGTVAGGVALAFATFNWGVLPRIDAWRPDLEAVLTQSTGRKVSIARLSGGWHGVAPRLKLEGVTLSNPKKGSALTLSALSLTPSWRSLVVWEPRFARIAVESPRLEFVRAKSGRIYLNGVEVSSPDAPASPSDGRLLNWLLAQRRIKVDGAALVWRDEKFDLPPLKLDAGNLELTDSLFGHKLKVSGRPGAELGRALRFEASWRGDDVNAFRRWSGEVALAVEGARVGAWSRYLAPIGRLSEGQGDGEMSARFDEGTLVALSADVKVLNVAFQPSGAGQVRLPQFGGKLDLKRDGDGVYRLAASDLSLSTLAGQAFARASVKGRYKPGSQGFGELSLSNADLAPLAPLIHALGASRNPLFARFAPQGRLSELSASWQGPIEAPRRYKLSTAFDKLGWVHDGKVPGVTGASGKLSFDETGGRVKLASRASRVTLPRVFEHPLAFDRFDADVDWRRQGDGVALTFNKVAFSNADLSGLVAGTYRYTGRGAGVASLAGGIERVDAVRVPLYLPYEAGKETLAWLKAALKGGRAEDVVFELKGELDRFPFRSGKDGRFYVAAKVREGVLKFEPDWPELRDIDADLVFENEAMKIDARRATTAGVPLADVKIGIPDLAADVPHLGVDGNAKGELAKMLAYTKASPVDQWLAGFTGQIAATGSANLALKLDIPLVYGVGPKVEGRITFANNGLKFNDWPIPAASDVNGLLVFTERGVESPGVKLSALGGPFVLKADTAPDGKLRFAVDGEADSNQVLKTYLPILAPYADGRSRYAVRFEVGKGLERLTVASTMVGTRLDAPPPAAKPAAAAWPLDLSLRPVDGQPGWGIDFDVPNHARGALRLSERGELLNGAIAVGRRDVDLPPRGLALRVQGGAIDLDAWRARLGGASSGKAGGDAGVDAMPFVAELEAGELSLAGYRFNAVKANAAYDPARRGWHVALNSKELAGEADYGGLAVPLKARLSKLALPLPSSTAAPLAGAASTRLPPLDIVADRVTWRDQPIGRVEALARREPGAWLLDRVRLTNDDGILSGRLSAFEAGGKASRVEGRFDLDVKDLGGLLGRFGEQGRIAGGRGDVSAELAWPGGVLNYKPETLNGKVTVAIRDGRFAQVDPGAGRLLGVLSLQSLARRLRFDFSDVFGKGFSFDRIAGDARIENGVFRSNEVKLVGPAADVTLKGEVDLPRDRQRVEVRVSPNLSEGAALATGAALLNPVFGVAALAAQKVLRDPLNQMFAVDYLITGPIAEPDVKQVSEKPLNPSSKQGNPP